VFLPYLNSYQTSPNGQPALVIKDTKQNVKHKNVIFAETSTSKRCAKCKSAQVCEIKRESAYARYVRNVRNCI